MKIEAIREPTDELRAAMARLLPQLSPSSPLPDGDFLAQMLAQPGCTLFVARPAEQQEIVGMATLILFHTPTGSHAWLEDVVVDEAWRGRGIGEQLTRTCIAAATQQGAKSLSLTSRPARVAANRLYQRLGFQPWQTNVYRLLLG
jgi:ribosomal protein S18 acetylase RimI-like enzyme